MKAQHIVNKIFTEGKSKDDAFWRNMKLQDQLLKCKDLTVDMLLQEIIARKEKGTLSSILSNTGSPFYFLMSVIKKVAEPKHAEILVEMLLWKEVLTHCRSIRCIIFDTLKRIGNSSNVVRLKEVGQRMRMEVDMPIHLYSDINAPSYFKMDEQCIKELIDHLEKKKT